MPELEIGFPDGVQQNFDKSSLQFDVKKYMRRVLLSLTLNAEN